MEKETIGFIEVFFASLLFGLMPIIVRFGNNLGPYNLSFFRVLVATISVFIFIVISKKISLTPFRYEKKKLIFFGAIHGFIILGLFLAIQYLTIASAVLLQYSSSIWIVVFSYFILKEKITKRTAFALLIAFIGLIFVVSPQNFFLKESFIGSLAGLGTGIGMGMVYTLSKTFKKYDKVSLTFWQNLIAIPFVTPLLFINLPKFSTFDIGIILLLGSLFTAVPFILIYKGFSKIKAQKGSVIIMLDIVFAVIFAWIVFKEIPTTFTIIGGAMILISTYIITIKEKKPIEEFNN
ncbi:MAG: DMT family transporter [Candidatus Pacearchaeota archaeon]|nr:DMT family transporter [Candidatus Pacearchaeota archaeon]